MRKFFDAPVRMVLALSVLFFLYQNCTPSNFQQHSDEAISHSGTSNSTSQETENGEGYTGKLYTHASSSGVCADGLSYDAAILVGQEKAWLVRESCSNFAKSSRQEVSVTMAQVADSLTYQNRRFSLSVDDGSRSCAERPDRSCIYKGVRVMMGTTGVEAEIRLDFSNGVSSASDLSCVNASCGTTTEDHDEMRLQGVGSGLKSFSRQFNGSSQRVELRVREGNNVQIQLSPIYEDDSVGASTNVILNDGDRQNLEF